MSSGCSSAERKAQNGDSVGSGGIGSIFILLLHLFVISYLVGAGGSSRAWEGADPGATTAAVPTVTGKGLAGWTAPP